MSVLNKLKISIIVLLCVSIIDLYSAKISILTPTVLKQKFLERYQNDGGRIPMSIMKFSTFPSNQSIRGFLFYSDVNNFCDSNNLPELDPTYYEDMDIPDNSIFFMVDQTTECSYSVQARNAKKKGAKMLIIASSNEETKHSSSHAGVDMDKVYIPIVTIKKSDALDIQTWAINNIYLDVTLEVSFQDDKETNSNSIVDIQFFLRSDDVKSIYFLKEFHKYYLLLEKRVSFYPTYKYYECLECNIDNTIEDKVVDACIRSDQYCGYPNLRLNVTNSRLMVLENLRQKCIYYLNRPTVTKPNDTYFKYIIAFANTCANIQDPMFNTKCSNTVMENLNIEKSEVENCMSNAINHSNNHLLDLEDKNYLSYSVFKVPTIIINGVTYKGNLLAQNVFEEVCSHLVGNKDGINADWCTEMLINENKPKDSLTGLFLLSIGITVILILFIFLYKKSIERSLDETIAEKIKQQAQGSLGQYHIFNDNDNSIVSKGIEVQKH